MNSSDVFLKALSSPEREFGEVPFYWWNGGELDKERIASQIKMLADKGLAGVQVNYAHINGGGENNVPHGGHGKSIVGSPEQFSDAWWDFFAFAAKECEKYGMSIGMGDYTIAWIGNGYFTDKVAALPDMHAKNIACEKKMLFAGDEAEFGDDVLFVITYLDRECTSPVCIYEKDKGILSPIKGMCEAFVITIGECDNSIDPLNPDSGKQLVKMYFKEFERRVPDVKKGTLNYFFQDELMFGTDIRTLWNGNLRTEIQKKYGYDVALFLPHLFFNLGNITPKIRLDTADVKTSLMEENYFKPVYEFHAERGLTYGCDQSGRGTQPDEFSDYFRTVRWFTAPGNDTPGRAADLIKVKVNSSIAHLYSRPRVWLEAYHSSGWGTTLDSITAATSDNFIFGANLLNLHGLYYSTDGGFFEWAPPDFHFRMPYWDDEQAWLDKYKRMSRLLTTGTHRCDVALYYPVSSCDYGENAKECTRFTFDCAEFFFEKGLDFDFIDFQSIDSAECKNGKLTTQTESYKALIFAGVDAVRYSCIQKAQKLLDCGGTVVFCGITPYASDRAGLGDRVLNEEIETLLSHKNCTLAPSFSEAVEFINSHITRSFLPDPEQTDKVYVHTRLLDNSTLYFVRYADKDSVCRFEAEGTAYLLNTDKSEVIRLNGTVAKDGFVFVKMPLAPTLDTLILFTKDDIFFDKELNTSGFGEMQIKQIIPLDGYWDFSLSPTLDNTYGDFYMPKGGIIGAEARFFDVIGTNGDEEIPDNFEFSSLPYCHSLSFKKISCGENTSELCEFLANNPHCADCESFEFDSTEYRVEIPLLHDRYLYISKDFEASKLEQGHHGLKGKIYNDNIVFESNCVFCTYVYSSADSKAYLKTGDIKPEKIFLNGNEITQDEIFLKKGKNFLCAFYIHDDTQKVNYRNRTNIKRTSLFVTAENPKKTDFPLSADAFANPDYFKLSKDGKTSSMFCFRFYSVPALQSFTANVFGEITAAYSNKEKADVTHIGRGNFGGNKYRVDIPIICPDVSEIVFFVKPENGIEFTGLIPEPITLQSGKGRIKCQDLSSVGALVNYSGKCIYEKDIEVQKLYPDEKFTLEIKDAAATLNIEINGLTAAVLTYRPFTADITDFIQNGQNHIKITVSNTLCNHYSTIPSRYSNFPQDASYGLMGEVNLIISENRE